MVSGLNATDKPPMTSKPPAYVFWVFEVKWSIFVPSFWSLAFQHWHFFRDHMHCAIVDQNCCIIASASKTAGLQGMSGMVKSNKTYKASSMNTVWRSKIGTLSHQLVLLKPQLEN